MNDAIARLRSITESLDEAYEENGGEVTDYTEAIEEQKELIAAILQTEGMDTLGRWLKSLEDEELQYKDEAAYIARKRKRISENIAFVKWQSAQVMKELGLEKIKGENGYSFTATQSTVSACDEKALKEDWLPVVKQLCEAANIPSYVKITISGDMAAAKNLEETPSYFSFTKVDNVTFRKPLRKKESCQ